jgi:FlaG/FlaF family flagellin (archaellin)
MADDLTDYEGELAGLKVVSIKASEDPRDFVPFVGAYRSMNNTLSIGSAMVMLSVDDPRSARTRYINDTRVRFSGIRVTAGSVEDLKLYGVTWHQSGSASTADITNVATVVNGVRYIAEEDDRYYTSLFAEPIIIPRGSMVDITIEGDLTTTGSNRTVQFDLEYATDLLLIGSTYGFGVYPTPEANTDTSGNSVFITSDGTTDGDSGFPYFVGSKVTVSGGTIDSIGKI